MKRIVCLVSLLLVFFVSMVNVSAAQSKYISASGSGYKTGLLGHYERAKINFDRDHVTPNRYSLHALLYGGLYGQWLDEVSETRSYVHWGQTKKSVTCDTKTYYTAVTGMYRVYGDGYTPTHAYQSYDSDWVVG